MSAFTGLLVLQAFFSLMGGVVTCEDIPQARTAVASPVCTRNCSSGDPTTIYSPERMCSCSESCSSLGDCCHDSPYKDAARWQRFDFVCVSVSLVGRYRAVSSCPENPLRGLCVANLGYLPPVTSLATGITYGNHYCAWCNGDDFERLVTWEVDLKCHGASEQGAEGNSDPFYIAYKRYEFRRINLRDGTQNSCQFHVRDGNASSLEKLDLRPCGPPYMISKCSDMWTDETVAEECRSYVNPVYYRQTRLYKNPHCAQCNYIDLNDLECKPRARYDGPLPMPPPPGPMGHPSIHLDRQPSGQDGMPGRPHSFSDLFKVVATTTTDCPRPDDGPCCVGERYDVITGRCRKVRQS